MTDRELLELAAKAAGLTKYSEWADKIEDYDSPHYMSFALHTSGFGGQADSWNPLTDDGDALRLAVRLGIVVNVWVSAGKTYAGDIEGQGCTEQHNGDSCAATRRAIVRAAAEIGKTLGE